MKMKLELCISADSVRTISSELGASTEHFLSVSQILALLKLKQITDKISQEYNADFNNFTSKRVVYSSTFLKFSRPFEPGIQYLLTHEFSQPIAHTFFAFEPGLSCRHVITGILKYQHSTCKSESQIVNTENCSIDNLRNLAHNLSKAIGISTPDYLGAAIVQAVPAILKSSGELPEPPFFKEYDLQIHSPASLVNADSHLGYCCELKQKSNQGNDVLVECYLKDSGVNDSKVFTLNSHFVARRTKKRA